MPRKRRTFSDLELRALDAAIAQPLAGVRPHQGWLRTVREALGMTRAQLAQRAGLSPQTIATLERNEARGAVTLASLEKLASAMGAKLHYVVAPAGFETFEALLRHRAEALAAERMERVSHTMALEDQAVGARHREQQTKRLVDSLLAGNRSALWKRK
jgi:predicted DNA-binding mobile mystery protein A